MQYLCGHEYPKGYVSKLVPRDSWFEFPYRLENIDVYMNFVTLSLIIACRQDALEQEGSGCSCKAEEVTVVFCSSQHSKEAEKEKKNTFFVLKWPFKSIHSKNLSQSTQCNRTVCHLCAFPRSEPR